MWGKKLIFGGTNLFQFCFNLGYILVGFLMLWWVEDLMLTYYALKRFIKLQEDGEGIELVGGPSSGKITLLV